MENVTFMVLFIRVMQQEASDFQLIKTRKICKNINRAGLGVGVVSKMPMFYSRLTTDLN